MQLATKLQQRMELTFQLTTDATDNDEAIHWSHMNGAYTALASLIARGAPQYDINEQVEQLDAVLREFNVDLDEVSA